MKFREITDDFQRIEWIWTKILWSLSILSEIIPGISWYMDWNKTIGITGIILGIIFFILPFVYTWIKNKKKFAEYIPFNEAVKILGESNYYDSKGHHKMWEQLGITQESYCRSQLNLSIKDKILFVYGRNNFSANKHLQKIEIEEYSKFHLGKENNLLSNLDEIKYIDLKICKKELLSYIENLKDPSKIWPIRISIN